MRLRQGWACAALAQIAFDNADNCLAVVRCVQLEAQQQWLDLAIA